LIRLFSRVIKEVDCIVLCGHRDKAAQDDAYMKDQSTKIYPNSKHNKMPSMAIDVAPFPVKMVDIQGHYFFAGYVKGIAKGLDIPIRWGGDWDSDNDFNDQTFYDLWHFELNMRKEVKS